METSYDYDFHVHPGGNTLCCWMGGIQLKTSTGDTKSFAPGEVIQVKDTTGKGHRTKNLEPKTKRSVFISF